MRSGSSLVVLSLVMASALAACGKSAPPPKAAEPAVAPPPPPVVTAEKKKEPPPPPKKTAKDVITPGSSFTFSLNDSDEQKAARLASCEKKKRDEDKQKCTDDALAAAEREGIRFELDEKSEGWVFTWFATDAKGKEVAYEKVTVANPQEDGDAKLVVEATDKDAGKKAQKLKKGDKLVFEVPDENTVVFVHSKDGKLVFKKH